MIKVSRYVSLCLSGVAAVFSCATIAMASDRAAPTPRSASDAIRPPVQICKFIKGPKHAVVAVGSTEGLKLDDGSDVQLAGILVARPPLHSGAFSNRQTAGARRSGVANNPSWPPTRDARKALETLVMGKSVQLHFSGRDRKTRYDAHLAQVFILEGDEKIWLQRQMVEQGYARVAAMAMPAPCAQKLLKAEAEARKHRRGLWGHAPYAVRPSWKTRELLRYQRTFQIVQGRVRSVGDKGGRVYLNFGKRWSDDFTATISKRARKRVERDGLKFSELNGATVRIRGWVEEWNGPAIRITDRTQIEIVKRARLRRFSKRRHAAPPRDNKTPGNQPLSRPKRGAPDIGI